MYKITDADKANFRSIIWVLRPSSAWQALVFVPPSGVVDTSAAPARYKGRITWTGDLLKSVASFVLSNVSTDDEQEYGIRIKFGLFDELRNPVDLKVLGKYKLLASPRTHTHTSLFDIKQAISYIVYSSHQRERGRGGRERERGWGWGRGRGTREIFNKV